MRFMIIRRADEETEAGIMPSPELIEAMGRYNEELAKAGVLLTGEGLMDSRNGAKVNFSQGRTTVTDGPFAEAKELIAGFTVIQVASLAEAVEWVRKWPAQDGHGNVQLEIRQIVEFEDFDDRVTDENRPSLELVRETSKANSNTSK